MLRRAFVIIGLPAIVIAVPLLLRRESSTVSPAAADDRLVIITPHTESICQEFGEAFARHWLATTGRTLYVDWRSPGGASEIRMVLDAGFEAAAAAGREGIGVDVYFGGGAPDFVSQAKRGRLAALEVFQTRPEWFEGEHAPIPQAFTGETYYPPDRVWIGTCLSRFGICHNPDVLARLGLAAPRTWDGLGDPRLAGSIALADPTKSGSVARAFELLIQDQIQRRLRAGLDRPTACREGWEAALRLIQRMAANARYFTDSASKIPLEVGQGDAAAGMVIDFYGRSFAASLTTASGAPRLVWSAPAHGTNLSADPIAVLKGAPHPRLAQEFVTFVLSERGQRLWCARPGVPDGPLRRALHRYPIRRDLYTPHHLTDSTLPDGDPYHDADNLSYDADLTGGSFNTVRQIVKAMCIDSHTELQAAWRAIIAAGMPADALAVMQDVTIMPYASGGKGDPLLDSRDALTVARRVAELGGWFRANYRKAEAIARRQPSG